MSVSTTTKLSLLARDLMLSSLQSVSHPQNGQSNVRPPNHSGSNALSSVRKVGGGNQAPQLSQRISTEHSRAINLLPTLECHLLIVGYNLGFLEDAVENALRFEMLQSMAKSCDLQSSVCRQVAGYRSFVTSLTAVPTKLPHAIPEATQRKVEMASEHWARLSKDESCGIRRGAWYRVVRAEQDHVVLAMGRDEMIVPRDVLEFLTDRPAKWSVVEGRRGSISLLAKWGRRYAVCPSCRRRQGLKGRPRILRCQRCNELFEVGWDDPFIVGAIAH